MHEYSGSKLSDLFKNVLLKFLLLYLTTPYYTQVFTGTKFGVQWIFLHLTKKYAQNVKFVKVHENFAKFLPKIALLTWPVVIVLIKYSLYTKQFMYHCRFYFLKIYIEQKIHRCFECSSPSVEIEDKSNNKT